ncbi:MAG: RHS repeat protein [Colwellia sp.]|nr:RHS repeat protein [Colwellia sp.]
MKIDTIINSLCMRSILVIFLLQIPLLFHVEKKSFAEDQEQISWRRGFDEQDRLSKLIDPANSETSFEYSTTPQKTQRVTKIQPEGNRVVWDYDKWGRLSKMIDGAGVVTYGYDYLGRPNNIQRQKEPALSYCYDLQDRIVSLRLGSFYELKYSYDFLGRLESINTPAGIITYNYQTGQGLLVRTLPNGIQTRWEIKANGQLNKITHGILVGGNKTQILVEYTYEYRADGLISSIGKYSTQEESKSSYMYDKVGRLIEATDTTGRQYHYVYDQVGNRLGTSHPKLSPHICSYDWAGRLLSVNGKTCTHDAAGNLTSIKIGDTTMKYRHNPEGQLKDVNGKVSYRYDGNGRLISRKSGEAEINFIPDPFSDIWQPLVIENEKGSGGKTLLVWDRNTPLIMIRNGKPEYMLHDHLGSIRLIVDDQGKVMRHVDYDPFGVMQDQTNATGFVPRYAGLFWDEEAQSYLTLNRLYKPEFGRFLQIDPIHHVPFGSQNVLSNYLYCGGNPVNFVDRDGAESTSFNIDLPTLYSVVDTLRFINELNNVPRDSVMDQVVTKAWKNPYKGKIPKSQEDLDWEAPITRAYWQALNWRYMKRDNEKKFNKEFSNSLNRPTYSELKNVENQLYAQMVVETGKHRPPFNRFPFNFNRMPGKDSADFMKNIGIPGWQTFHQLAESPLGKYLKWDKFLDPEGMHPQDIMTIPRQLKGVQAALNILGAREAEKLFVKGLGYKSNEISSVSVTRADRSKMFNRKRLDVLPDTSKYYFFGGGPPPGGGGGTGEHRRSGGVPWGSDDSTFRSMSPSTVGGVYLGGAGKVLDDTGLFEGVALDSDNNLILLSKSGDEINLPPLRLDDLVTVFRSVYINGEGPTVTINPNPDNPEGPIMIIKHGKATEDTYVGWILYHADRLMKCYTLGVNNINTDEDFVSAVPGYEEVLDALYFGDDTPEKLRKGGCWERFWIVPSYSRCINNVHKDLTLFEVPLKVKSQVMKWEEGKLVDDYEGKSSVGAMEFIEWFTRHYDPISRERYLTPPSESGITKPVPVFSELRRVALMTAIAEKLKDQGIPMPFWMRNYEVSPVIFEKTTPALLKERSNDKLTAQVYGGVNMSPESKDVEQFTQKSDLSNLPDTKRKVVEKLLKRANSISKVIQESLPALKPFRSHKIPLDDDTYNILSIPGSEVRALAPCQLEEIDMIVPIEGGYEISLSRYYNSFFDPSGLWGRGWTLNLPWLEEVKVPITRKGSQVKFWMDYELLAPFNNLYTRFSGVRKVPSLNNSQLQTPDRDCGFFGLADGSPTFLSLPTLKLLCKNGEIWHFTKAGDHVDKSGDLVAIERDGFRTVYQRNMNGRVLGIAGWLGSHKLATIEFGYDEKGRLESAIGQNNNGEQKIRYEYDTSGKLASVISDQGKLGYRYTGSWVTSKTWQDFSLTIDDRSNKEEILRRFEYNGKGQLFAESNEDGQRITYGINSSSQGDMLTVTNSKEKDASVTIRYDTTNRPVEARYGNGTQANWAYSGNGENVTIIKYPKGKNIKITESADRQRQIFEVTNMPELTKEYDKAGRLTAITENEQNIIRQHWYQDGKLQAIENDNYVATPQYNQDGLVTSVTLSPPKEKESLKPKHWQMTEMDFAGRPVKILDYQGLNVQAQYDNNGNINQVVTERDKEKYGFNITRDDLGRIHTIDSSWDNQQFKYNEDGTLATISLSKKSYENKIQQSVLEFESGKLINAEQFDGGKVTISYYSEEPHEDVPKQVICANGLDLNYYYNPLNKLEKVKVGDQSQIALDYDTKGRIIGYTYRPAGN